MVIQMYNGSASQYLLHRNGHNHLREHYFELTAIIVKVGIDFQQFLLQITIDVTINLRQRNCDWSLPNVTDVDQICNNVLA